MNRQRLFSMLCYFFILSFLMINVCSRSVLPIDKNEPPPPIIKKYGHKTLLGLRKGMQETGIYLNEGDIYSILATGSIDMGSVKNNEKPERGYYGHGRLIARIGKTRYFRPLYFKKADKLMATNSGKLYLGIQVGKMTYSGEPLNPEYYENIKGAFRVDIIVWEREDWVQIAHFFEKMKEKDPSNRAIIAAFEQANRYKNMYLAEAKASKEIEETKKKLQELKVEPPLIEQDTEVVTENKPIVEPKSSTVDMADHEKVKELETKLAELLKTLTQIDGMKAQLEEERKKITQLTQELEEKDERERELLSKIEGSSNNPPVIVIAAPSDGVKTESKAIQLTGVAEDDTGISQIDIYANNKAIVPEDGRGLLVKEIELPKRYRFNERIALNKGLNTIKIRSVDADGLSAEVMLKITRIERRRNVWALVVGINEYQNVRNLKYAVNDAEAFYNLLVEQNQVPRENVILLTDKKASLKNLRRALGTQLKKRAGKEDMVIIFFAGHGATEKDASSPDGDGLEKYLLPVDAELDDIYTSAIPMREISHIFRRIKSERIIFIADSCYSGASGGRTVNATGIRSSLSGAFLDRVVSGKGTIIITASGANEVSMESEEFKHGIFSYFLLEGLKGKADFDADGLVTVDELYPYVYDNVARASGQEQHPVKKGTVEGRFVFGVVR